jgi:hypothetical protein
MSIIIRPTMVFYFNNLLLVFEFVMAESWISSCECKRCTVIPHRLQIHELISSQNLHITKDVSSSPQNLQDPSLYMGSHLHSAL